MEIQVAADRLDVDVYTFVDGRWLKYSCNSVCRSGSLYLDNVGECCILGMLFVHKNLECPLVAFVLEMKREFTALHGEKKQSIQAV